MPKNKHELRIPAREAAKFCSFLWDEHQIKASFHMDSERSVIATLTFYSNKNHITYGRQLWTEFKQSGRD